MRVGIPHPSLMYKTDIVILKKVKDLLILKINTQ